MVEFMWERVKYSKRKCDLLSLTAEDVKIRVIATAVGDLSLVAVR